MDELVYCLRSGKLANLAIFHNGPDIYIIFFIKVQLGSTVTSTVGRTLHQNTGNKTHKYLKRSD